VAGSFIWSSLPLKNSAAAVSLSSPIPSAVLSQISDDDPGLQIAQAQLHCQVGVVLHREEWRDRRGHKSQPAESGQGYTEGRRQDRKERTADGIPLHVERLKTTLEDHFGRHRIAGWAERFWGFLLRCQADHLLEAIGGTKPLYEGLGGLGSSASSGRYSRNRPCRGFRRASSRASRKGRTPTRGLRAGPRKGEGAGT